jgi:hypothetical protein
MVQPANFFREMNWIHSYQVWVEDHGDWRTRGGV